MGIRLGLNTFLLTPLVCRQLVKGKTTYSHPILSYNIQNRLLSQWGTKKKHRNVKINLDWCRMGDSETETILAPFREKVKEQVKYDKQFCNHNHNI